MTEHSPLAWLADVERRRRAEGLRRSLRVRPAVATVRAVASSTVRPAASSSRNRLTTKRP